MSSQRTTITAAPARPTTLPAGAGMVVLVGSVLAVAVLLSPFLGFAIGALNAHDPKLAHDLSLVSDTPGGWDFGRVFRRAAMILILPTAFVLRRRLPPFRLVGTQAGNPRLRFLLFGCVVGTSAIAGLVVLLLATDVLEFAPKPWTDWPYNLAEAIVIGLIVGAFEESILRGWLQENLGRRHTLGLAVLFTTLPWAVLHYFRAVVPVSEPGFDPWLGVRALAAHGGAMLDPATLAPLVGLLLVGALLGFAYGWSRSLPFAIGVHAGLVGSMKLVILVTNQSFSIDWMWGPGGVLGRPVVWLFLPVMVLIVRLLLSRRDGRSNP